VQKPINNVRATRQVEQTPFTVVLNWQAGLKK